MKKSFTYSVLIFCLIGCAASLWCIMDESLTNDQQILSCFCFLGSGLLGLAAIELDNKKTF